MRLINKDDFIKMPEGTIYCKYTVFGFENMYIKGRSYSDDIIETLRIGHHADLNVDSGEVINLFHKEWKGAVDPKKPYGKDKVFREDLFLIYSVDDLRQIIKQIQGSIGDFYPIDNHINE